MPSYRNMEQRYDDAFKEIQEAVDNAVCENCNYHSNWICYFMPTPVKVSPHRWCAQHSTLAFYRDIAHKQLRINRGE